MEPPVFLKAALETKQKFEEGGFKRRWSFIRAVLPQEFRYSIL